MAFFWVNFEECCIVFQNRAQEDIGFRRGIRYSGDVWSRVVLGRNGFKENQIMNGTFLWFWAYVLAWFLVWL